MKHERGKQYVHNIPAARRLRRPQTESEALLWTELRDRRFMGQKFRRQHAIGQFVVDLYCHHLRLAIEVDGGIHQDEEQQRRDSERQAIIEEGGVRFMRITADQVIIDMDGTLEEIRRFVPPLPRSRERGPGGEGPALVLQWKLDLHWMQTQESLSLGLC